MPRTAVQLSPSLRRSAPGVSPGALKIASETAASACSATRPYAGCQRRAHARRHILAQRLRWPVFEPRPAGAYTPSRRCDEVVLTTARGFAGPAVVGAWQGRPGRYRAPLAYTRRRKRASRKAARMSENDPTSRLPAAVREHLANVADNLQLVADMGYGDVALLVPTRAGGLTVLADARPMTAPAAGGASRAGETLDAADEPEAA
ncbi:MAG: hypothetical protein FDZ70_06940, partial [Actinobacteria bacterium]